MTATPRPPLPITRQALIDQIVELKERVGEVYDNLQNAHDRHNLDTMDFYAAKEHLASFWRTIDYAIQAVRGR